MLSTSVQANNSLYQGHQRFPALHGGIAWLTIGIALLTGCAQDTGTETTSQLIRGISGEPASLDPAASIDSFSTQLVSDLYEGLTTESSSGEVLPGVASSWSIDPKGTRYTFTLRSNARWSNGQPVKAQQFVNAWRRILDPKTGSPLANDLRLIVGASAIISGAKPASELSAMAISDELLVVDIERPTSFFPQILSHPAAFPIFSDTSAKSRKTGELISDGPYELADWRLGSALALKKNESYWDAASVRINKVKYVVATDANAQLSAYRAGQIDMTDTIPANSLKTLRLEHANEIVTAPYLATAYYALNITSAPLSKSEKLRQSLSMAIDRAALVNSMALGQVAAFGFVPPGTLSYEPQSWTWKSLTTEDRLAEAKRLYAEAGYSSRHPLRLRLLLNSNPSIRQTAILVTAMWKEKLGVETTLLEEEFRVFLQSRHERTKWDVARLAWNADYNDASNFLDILRSDSPNNDPSYQSIQFDSLLAQASTAQDASQREKLLERAERTMLENYPIIPLYFFVSKRLVKPNVHGVHPNPLDKVASKMLWMSNGHNEPMLKKL